MSSVTLVQNIKQKVKCWRIDAFKLWCWRTLKSPLDCEEIKPVNPKGNQSWIFIGRTDAEAEAPILWPPDAKGQLIGKDPHAGKDWGQEKRATEDEMVGWHHWLNKHELEQFREMVKEKKAWHAAVHGVTKSWTQLREWTTSKVLSINILLSTRGKAFLLNHKAKQSCLY